MYIKNLLFSACLLAGATLGANNFPTHNAEPIGFSNDGASCNLSAPLNFRIEELGTSWVKYAWGGNASYAHRIRTYRASDNALLNTTIVPQGNGSWVVDNLPSGTELYGIINALCSDGSNSSDEGTSGTGTTLIVELLINGFQAPLGGTTGCTFIGDIDGSCPINVNTGVNNYFKIWKTETPTDCRYFALRRNVDNYFSALITEGNGDNISSFDLKCNSQDPDLITGCAGPHFIEIWADDQEVPATISTFTAVFNPIQMSGILFYNSLGYNDYTFQRIIPSERGFTSSASNQAAFVSPNPFSEALEVFLPASAETVSLQLYNLNGQQVLNQQFAGGQEQFSLPTSDLAPGFYMLRIEADGEIQTLKVVKSE